jgi:hypothetical protein
MRQLKQSKSCKEAELGDTRHGAASDSVCPKLVPQYICTELTKTVDVEDT